MPRQKASNPARSGGAPTAATAPPVADEDDEVAAAQFLLSSSEDDDYVPRGSASGRRSILDYPSGGSARGRGRARPRGSVRAGRPSPSSSPSRTSPASSRRAPAAAEASEGSVKIKYAKGGAQPLFAITRWAIPGVLSIVHRVSTTKHRVLDDGPLTAAQLERQSESFAPLPPAAMFFLPARVGGFSSARGAAELRVYLRIVEGDSIEWYHAAAADLFVSSEAWAQAVSRLILSGAVIAGTEMRGDALQVGLFASTAAVAPTYMDIISPSFPPRQAPYKDLAVLFSSPRALQASAAIHSASASASASSGSSSSSSSSQTESTVFPSRIVRAAGIPAEYRGEDAAMFQATVHAHSSASATPGSNNGGGGGGTTVAITDEDLYAAAAPRVGDRVPSLSTGALARIGKHLKATLRGYQVKGVAWCLERENRLFDRSHVAPPTDSSIPPQFLSSASAGGDGLTPPSHHLANLLSACPVFSEPPCGTPTSHSPESAPHPLFSYCVSSDGRCGYYVNPACGQIVLRGEWIQAAAHSWRSTHTGGIFADEMGLGKTVCALSLVASTERSAALEAGRILNPAVCHIDTAVERMGCIPKADSPPMLPKVPLSMLVVSESENLACICGVSYLAPLTTEEALAVTMLRAQGGSPPVKRRVRQDTLDWVSCCVCRRWQHALCGGCTRADSRSTFMCTECQAIMLGGSPLESGANIIICPPQLHGQWLAETAKHTFSERAPPVTFEQVRSLRHTRGKESSSTLPSSTSASQQQPAALRVVQYAGVKVTARILRDKVLELDRLRRAASGVTTVGLRGASSNSAAVSGKRKARAWEEVDSSDEEAVWDSYEGLALATPSAVATTKRTAAKRQRTGEQTQVHSASGNGSSHSLSLSAAHSSPAVGGDSDSDTDMTGSSATPASAAILALENEIVQLALTLSPFYLSVADIVLTTYDALANDLHHVDTNTAEFLSVTAGINPCEPADYMAEVMEHVATPNHIRGQTISEIASVKMGRKGDVDAKPLIARRTLRNQKKYRVIISPLLHVQFFRVCVDEAQELDTPTVKCAEVARRLFAVHRWCISGTPFRRTAADFLGLLMFLDWYPFCIPAIFNQLLLQPAGSGSTDARAALLALAHDAVWRTRKAAVVDELGLPPLTRETIVLRSAPIETVYYQRLFTKLREELGPVLARWEADERRRKRANPGTNVRFADDVPLDRGEVDQVMGALMKLRQTCVHPQIGDRSLRKKAAKSAGAGLRASANAHTRHHAVSTLADVLALMLGQARLDCEAEVRTVVWAKHALAGLAWAEGKQGDAEREYLSVVNLVSELAKDGTLGLQVDKLQQIHAFRSLHTILMAKAAAPPSASQQHPTTLLLHAADIEVRAQHLEDAFLRATAYRVAHVFNKLKEQAGRAAGATVRTQGHTHVGVDVSLSAGITVTPSSAAASGSGSGSHTSGAPTGTSGPAATSATTSIPSFHAGIAVPLEELEAVLEDGKSSCESSETVALLCVKHLLDVALVTTKDARGFSSYEADLVNVAEGGDFVSLEEMEANPLLRGSSSTSVVWDLGKSPSVKFNMLRAYLYDSIPRLFTARSHAVSELRSLLHPTSQDVKVASECGQCRKDWGKKGPPCFVCRAKIPIKAFRDQLINFKKRSLLDAEITEGSGPVTATGRAKRKTRKNVLGADGNLNAFLEDVVEGEGDEAVATGQDAGAGGEADDPTRDLMLKDTFQAPTAMCRVLKELASLSRHVDGAVIPLPGADDTEAGTGISSSRSNSGGGSSNSGGGSNSGAGVVAVVWESGGPLLLKAGCVEVETGTWLGELVQFLITEGNLMWSVMAEQHQLMLALDELASCLTRMQIVPDDEEVSEAESNFRVKAYEIPERRSEFTARLAEASTALDRAKRQFQYLCNIQREEEATAANTTGTAASAGKSSGTTGAVGAAPVSVSSSCPICLDDFQPGKEIVVLSTCFHRMCRSHLSKLTQNASELQQWGRTGLKCPYCRKPFTDADVVVALYGPASEVQPASGTATAGTAAPSTASSSAGVGAEAASRTAATAAGPTASSGLTREHPYQGGDGCYGWAFNPEPDTARISALPDNTLTLVGSYGTKIEAIVRSLKLLVATSGDGTSGTSAGMPNGTAGGVGVGGGPSPTQAIIFSEWDESLAICEAALSRNGVSAIRLEGASGVSGTVGRFIADPTITALLMPLRTGSEGLNLTNASHVFFMEPVLTAAQEGQAVGRIYRLGQVRPTFVHQYIVAGTLEDTVLRLATASSHFHSHDAVSGGGGGGVGVDDYSMAAAQQSAHASASASSSIGGGGGVRRGKAGGSHVTRGDILSLMDAEREFEEHVNASTSASSATGNKSTGVASMPSASLPSADEAIVIDGDEPTGTPTPSSGRIAAAPRSGAGKADAAAEAVALVRDSRRDQHFWTSTVRFEGSETRRLRLLGSLPSVAPTSTIHMFGRPVPVDVAAVLTDVTRVSRPHTAATAPLDALVDTEILVLRQQFITAE